MIFKHFNVSNVLVLYIIIKAGRRVEVPYYKSWVEGNNDNFVLLKLEIDFQQIMQINFNTRLILVMFFFLSCPTEKLFAEKKCITVRFRGHGYFPLSVFQRLLSSVVSVWSVVNFSGKPLLAADVGAFSLDSFHRLVLACHEECIDVYVYHKSGSVYVNPTVTRNVRHFLELNLTRILCVTSSVKQTTQFVHSVNDSVIRVTTKEKVRISYSTSQIFHYV